MVVEFVIIYRALPIPHNLDYYEFLKHKESSALVGMRFTHGINDKTLPRVFLNGFDVGFYQRSHLGLQRSDAPFANIAWVNIKQNSFIGIKRPVVKTADFVGHRFLYGGFHNGLEFFGLAIHKRSDGFSPFGVLVVQNLGQNNTVGHFFIAIQYFNSIIFNFCRKKRVSLIIKLDIVDCHRFYASRPIAQYLYNKRFLKNVLKRKIIFA